MIALIIIPCLVVVFLLCGIKIIRPTHRGLIERFGKYKIFANPGFHWIIPGVDKMISVDVTENMVNASKQEVITKDNLNATVDAQVYFKVKSTEEAVKASQYNVSVFDRQIVSLARTTLRNIIGTLSLKEANSERSRINLELAKSLSGEVSSWGVDILRSELQEIDPPADVQGTMNQIVKAENAKIAAIDFSKAAETEADGFRMAAVKKAQGQAEAVILQAEAEAKSIKIVNEAAEKYFIGNAQLLKQYEVMENALEKNTKYIFTEKGVRPILLFGDEINGRSGTA